MHRPQYLKPIPKPERFPRWRFFALYFLNVAVAIYCVTTGKHAFPAFLGLFAGAALLWNLHRAFNFDEISGGSGQAPLFRRAKSPVGFWFHVALFVLLYLTSLVVPPLVTYADSGPN